MQTDSHFYVTYILCRWAGLDHNNSYKTAYASQYVDDACLCKLLKFSDGFIFKPECTAHTTTNYNQLSSYDNVNVLTPFHFFPDINTNMVLPFGMNDNLKDLVFNTTLELGIDKYIYLGMLLHIIADTYSHQEFYGFRCNDNQIEVVRSGIKNKLKSLCYKFKMFVSRQVPVGHAAAFDLPDIPGLKWAYKRNKKIYLVDNEEKYNRAYQNIYTVICSYIKTQLGSSPLPPKDLSYVAIMFEIMLEGMTEYSTEDERCTKWKELIKGDFGIDISYDKNLWFKEATAIKETKTLDKILFMPIFDYLRCEYKSCHIAFMESDWVSFHKCAKYYKTQFHKLFINL